MSILKHTRILALAGLLTIGLSGCFANPVEQLVQNRVEDAVEGAVEDAAGSDVDLGGTTLPDGFPSDAVPVIEGEIVYGAGMGGEAWAVMVKVADRDAAYAEVKQLLTDKGFETTMESSAEGGAFAIFTSDAYVAQVTVGESGADGIVAQYAVTANTP
jgi:ABC-type glycerol-3-phosphate transport system substrate-binding protein